MPHAEGQTVELRPKLGRVKIQQVFSVRPRAAGGIQTEFGGDDVFSVHYLTSGNSWERRHPCLLASVSRLSPEARRQGCLRSQGRFSFFRGAATGMKRPSGNQ